MSNPRNLISRFAQNRHVLLLLILIAIVNFCTMPRAAYQGDAYAIRLEGVHLLEKGDIGIPIAKGALMKELVAQEGQYFFFNREKGKLYSKWGILNTVLFLPPVVMERILFQVNDLFEPGVPVTDLKLHTKPLMFLLNVYNICFSLLIALYLYRLAELFSGHLISRYVFVLGIFYSTFVWNYLRAQSPEIFQIFLFAAFFFHLVRFQRQAKAAGKREAWPHLLACAVCAGLLSLTKIYYILIFPILTAVVILEPGFRGALWGGSQQKQNARRLMLSLGLPTLATLSVILFVNHYKYGSFFESGYGQWRVSGSPHDEFSIAYPPEALEGFLFGANSSLFTHFPILIVALFGLRMFWKKYPAESRLIGVFFLSFLLFFSSFSNWSGAWCYGPRYLLFILPIASLPFLSMADFLLKRIKTWPAIACTAAIVFMFLYSLRLQINVNTAGFFFPRRLQSIYALFHDPKIDACFQKHLGLVMGDFLAHRDGSRPFPPLEELKKILPPDQTTLLKSLDEIHRPGSFVPNYYFCEQNGNNSK